MVEETRTQVTKTIDVVVAHYNEDVCWVLDRFQETNTIFIYTKGSDKDLGSCLLKNSSNQTPHIVREDLPNVGRESHTYLHHIITHYDDLPDVLHFTQGSIEDHRWWCDSVESFVHFEGSHQACPYSKVLPLSESDVTDEYRNKTTHNDIFIPEWARTYVDPDLLDTDSVRPFTNGIFSILRHRVLSRTRDFYVHLKEQLEVSKNPLCGHYFERLWHRIFNCHVPQATTIVSCFYRLRQMNVDLKKSPDEDEDSWLESFERTCRLSHPMVIYTDCTQHAERIRGLRARQGLGSLTEVVILPFEGLSMAPWLGTVVANRKNYWPTRDPRCEAEVHVLMMSRFDLVARVAEWNPFKSTHVCQMDLNLLTKKPNGSCNYTDNSVFKKLDAILSSTAMVIEAWDPCCFKDLRKFYSLYRYQIAGTFWTAETEVAVSLARSAQEVAVSFTEQGYGHGDEHILARVADLRPELFTFTMGDYQDIVENYFYPRSNLTRVQWILKSAENVDASGTLFRKLKASCNGNRWES